MSEKIIRWDDNTYSIGIDEIDDQHKNLVELINQLNEASLTGKTEIEIGDTIRKMYYYTDYHFETEENYFRKFNYPETTTHLKEHKLFLKKVLQFRREYEDGGELIFDEVFSFLKNWLLNHILVSDKKYVALFKENGVK